jgi:hypothetical protein
MELEPGIITPQPMPLPPRVSRDGFFESFVNEIDGLLSGGDVALAVASARVGDGAPTDLNAAYDRTVGVALETHAAEVGRGSGSVADALIGHGENIDALRASVLQYLPQPDAPIDATFVEPPDSGVIGTGRGFDTPVPSREQPPTDPDPGGTPPRRETVVRAQVRRLYLELLGREPDAAGWDNWVDAVLNLGYTIADVRAAILASDEYLSTH